MSGEPKIKLDVNDVWAVLQRAEGRCVYCGSLAVERRPSMPNGAPAPWEGVGRRIGSLGHNVARFHEGDNDPANLSWVCLWCNTWPDQRVLGATDHGGLPPAS